MSESYPPYRAGQKATAALLASALPQVVRKTADTSRSTTAVADDPHLSFSVEANAVYIVEGMLLCSNTTADDDINLDWTVPSGSDGSWGGVGYQLNTAGGTDANARMFGQSITSARSFGTSDDGAAGMTVILIHATLITGSTAGTHTLQWAQLQSTGTLTVYADSFLKYTRIA
jgi:hypothetical protein